jgi:hypothetical protein
MTGPPAAGDSGEDVSRVRAFSFDRGAGTPGDEHEFARFAPGDGMTGERRETEPVAGHLLRARPGVRGLAQACYGG